MFTHAFILAAGMGSRLRPYTDTLPKPMVSVAGQSIIYHILDRLIQAGVTDVTINLHYLGDLLEEHLSYRTDINITFSYEETLLDTGGGIKKALNSFENNPFFIINGDAFWVDGDINIFNHLQKTWQEKRMDILLALQPTERMKLTKGVGDYILDSDGQAKRSPVQEGDMMFAGIRLCHPRVFNNTPDESFSFLKLMDQAEADNRLYGLEHKGEWHHISTAEDLERVHKVYV